jgi:hypothetical protein
MEEEVLAKEVAPDPIESPESETITEKMIPVSRVEELIKKAKLKGRDHMQPELDALRAENDALKQGSMGGMSVPVNPDQIKQQILDDLKQQFQEAAEARANEEMTREAERIAKEYRGKMEAAKPSYEDFDTVMADFNPSAFPNLVYLANQVDNTPGVMMEIMRNPSKWATLAVLSEKDPNAAKNMIGRISASIKANELAKTQEKDIAPPLNRLSSSTAGQDNGIPSLNDLKRKYRG